MSSFFSFLKTKKILKKEDYALLFTQPFTLAKAMLTVCLTTAAIVALLLVQKISHYFSVAIPDYGGTIQEGVIGAPRFITPLIATTDTDRLLVRLLFSGVIAYDPMTQTVTPLLTENITTNSDNTSIAITLKKGVNFSDGTPMTSADVAFSFQMYSALASTTKEQMAWDSIVVQTPDDYTVTLSTNNKALSLFSYAASPVISKKQWENVPIASLRESTNALHPVGTGPFALSHISYKNTIPDKVYLKRNSRSVTKKVFPEKVIVTLFANQLALQQALENGTSNSTIALAPTFITEKMQRAYTAKQYPTATVVGIFKQQQTTQELQKLLEIISPIFDRNRIVATIENGYGIPLGDTTTTSDTVLSGLERLGYKKDAQGFVTKQGTPLRLSIALRKDTELLDTAAVIAENLQTIGIATDIKVFDQGMYIDEIGRQSFSLLLEKTDTPPTGYTLAIPFYRKTITHITTEDIFLPDTISISTKEHYWESIPSWSMKKDMVWKWFANKK